MRIKRVFFSIVTFSMIVLIFALCYIACDGKDVSTSNGSENGSLQEEINNLRRMMLDVNISNPMRWVSEIEPYIKGDLHNIEELAERIDEVYPTIEVVIYFFS